ncbi:hypothetical protein B0H17DRAFT_1052807 [Mycena rosella]|uniref:Uncharacterized protein n=1 Tax=Mycena rosella TaxID=1033263 RepID=A0AAD7DRX5_MYCRO|nr:hypothetical protein B0H17DRAFT_1052807 [Mycena rosella]
MPRRRSISGRSVSTSGRMERGRSGRGRADAAVSRVGYRAMGVCLSSPRASQTQEDERELAFHRGKLKGDAEERTYVGRETYPTACEADVSGAGYKVRGGVKAGQRWAWRQYSEAEGWRAAGSVDTTSARGGDGVGKWEGRAPRGYSDLCGRQVWRAIRTIRLNVRGEGDSQWCEREQRGTASCTHAASAIFVVRFKSEMPLRSRIHAHRPCANWD